MVIVVIVEEEGCQQLMSGHAGISSISGPPFRCQSFVTFCGVIVLDLHGALFANFLQHRSLDLMEVMFGRSSSDLLLQTLVDDDDMIGHHRYYCNDS